MLPSLQNQRPKQKMFKLSDDMLLNTSRGILGCESSLDVFIWKNAVEEDSEKTTV